MRRLADLGRCLALGAWLLSAESCSFILDPDEYGQGFPEAGSVVSGGQGAAGVAAAGNVTAGSVAGAPAAGVGMPGGGVGAGGGGIGVAGDGPTAGVGSGGVGGGDPAGEGAGGVGAAGDGPTAGVSSGGVGAGVGGGGVGAGVGGGGVGAGAGAGGSGSTPLGQECMDSAECAQGSCLLSPNGVQTCQLPSGDANEPCGQPADCQGGHCLPHTIAELEADTGSGLCAPGAATCGDMGAPAECLYLANVYCAFVQTCGGHTTRPEYIDFNVCVTTECSDTVAAALPANQCSALASGFLTGVLPCP